MSNIRLQINIGTDKQPSWQTAWLSEDATITMECVNPVFDTNAGGTFSHEFDLDCDMNRHIIGNVDEIHGGNIYKRLYGKRFKLSYKGIHLMSGLIWIDKETSVEEGKIGITLRSGNKEWNNLIDNKKLRDLDFIEVPEHRVPCGLTFPDNPTISMYKKDTIIKNYSVKYVGNRGGSYMYFAGDSIKWNDEEIITLSGLTFPPILFVNSKGHEYVNTSNAYDPKTKGNKYCNIRTCLQRYMRNGDNWETRRDYNTHEPEMMNSAPCFYVAYIFDRVVEALKVNVTENCFSRIPDFYRVALIHTNCAYRYKDYNDKPIKMVSEFIPEPSAYNEPNLYFTNDEVQIHFSGFVTGEHRYRLTRVGLKGDAGPTAQIKKAYRFVRKNDDNTVDMVIREYQGHSVIDNESFDLYEAYATEENLPDISFSDFLSGIQNAFGIRYIYDPVHSTLSVVLLKDVLKQTDSEVFPIRVSSVCKEELHTTGFVLKYDNSVEYKKRGITGTLLTTSGDDDTYYNYYDYRGVVLYGKEQSTKNENIPANYKGMLQFCSDDNKRLYIDSQTGNSYRLKVDKEAKTTSEWYPSWFEVGGYRDVRIGDCHSEDTTETISIGFAPVNMNDVNGKAEYLEGFNTFTEKDGVVTYSTGEAMPKYALLVEGETHMNFDEDGNPDGTFFRQDYTYDNMGIEPYYNEQKEKRFMCSLNVTLSFSCKLNYDYTQNDIFHDGEPEFILGVARGGGRGSYKYEYNYDYDGEGNSNWTQVAGSNSELFSDNIDSCGQRLGDSKGELLSLKLKAEKPYKGGLTMTDEDGKQYLVTDFLSNTRPIYDSDGYDTGDTELAYYPVDSTHSKRGLFDLFYTEYAYFALNRKVAKIRGEVPISSLLNIDLTKKYKMGNITGWIKKYTYTLDNDELRDINIELYYI